LSQQNKLEEITIILIKYNKLILLHIISLLVLAVSVRQHKEDNSHKDIVFGSLVQIQFFFNPAKIKTVSQNFLFLFPKLKTNSGNFRTTFVTRP